MKQYRPVAAIILEREGTYLLVRKPRKKHAWQFPQGGVDEGETFLEAAKRELAEECGSDLKVQFVSEIPVGTYKYLFPEGFVRACDGKPPRHAGAEVHFFVAQWQSGEPKPDGIELVEARWCEIEEIQTLVEEKYWEVVKNFF